MNDERYQGCGKASLELPSAIASVAMFVCETIFFKDDSKRYRRCFIAEGLLARDAPAVVVRMVSPFLGVIKSEMANITDVPVRLVVAFFSFGCSAEEDLVHSKLP